MRTGARLRIGILSVAIPSLALVAMSRPSLPGFGDPLDGLTDDQLDRFRNGKAEFQTVETVADGLGPVFNDVSCASCHSVPAVGGGSSRLVTRFGRMTEDGLFDPLSELGGTLVHSQGIGPQATCTYLGEIVSPQATITTGRRSTPLFGLGLVEAVPDQTFRDLATLESHDPDGIAGIVSMVTDLNTGLPAVGRFGWKAQVPTLHQFAGDAYLNEMGITTPQFPNEICPQGDCYMLSCNPRPDMNDEDEAVSSPSRTSWPSWPHLRAGRTGAAGSLREKASSKRPDARAATGRT